MRFVKTLCLCSCILGVLGASAMAQVPEVFITPDGAQGGGNQTIFTAPGTSIPLVIWIQDNAQVDQMGGYTVEPRCHGVGGASGTVSYQAASMNQDQSRPDWALAGGGATFAPSSNEDCAGAPGGLVDGFVTATAFTAAGVGVSLPTTPVYAADFILDISADACGTFTIGWVPGPVGVPFGGSGLVDSSNQPFGTTGFTPLTDYQILTIVVGPGNDDCAAAASASNGGNAVDNRCAVTDGPVGACGIVDDVWFTYTATCTGDLVATAAGYDVGIYNNGCPAADADELNCGTGSASIVAASGTTYLVRVGGTQAAGTLDISCTAFCDSSLPAGPVHDADCGGPPANQCQLNGCDAVLGCILVDKASGEACDDSSVCTQTDACDGAGSCVGSNNLDCNDFADCTVDTCDAVTGCSNVSEDGTACTVDADCRDGGSATATCVAGVCDCKDCLNLNDPGTVCIDLRNAGNVADGGNCTTDADCATGICIDNNSDPLDGGVCVDQACYGLGDPIIVDIELGSTTDPACGAQLFLAYDTSTLDLKSVSTDPDGELGWSFELVNIVDEAAGTIDLAFGLPIGTVCDDSTGTFNCGTMVRLTFTAIADCKAGGVWIRANNPTSIVSGPNGEIAVTSCDGGALDGSGLAAGTINVNNDPPVFTCPDDFDGNSDCNSILATIDLGDPISVSDACAQVTDTGTDLCTATFFAACTDALDCGVGALCNADAECGSNNCVPDALAGELGSLGFCALDSCTDGTCDTASAFNVDYLLGGGVVTLPPGCATVSCSYTNDCGVTSTCDRNFCNSGMNLLCVDVEMSPSMVAGDVNNPITRCIDFELTLCDAAGDPVSVAVSTEVVFGAPNNIPGHGSVCFKVPPNNWTCLTAMDPKHSLRATCFIECVDNVYYAQFKGSPNTNPLCHWLIQGNLNADEHIDIVDYTILAGQYLDNVGSNSLCKGPNPPLNNFHADLNGDGYVTIADFTFIVFNFFDVAKDPCDVICNPGLAPAKQQPRSEISVRELNRMGLGDYARAADVNRDGKVNLADMAQFLELNGEGDEALTIELLDAVDSRISDSAGLR